MIAHNLARWTARIGLGEQIVTTKTLRRRFFSMAGRLTPLGAPPHFASAPALALGSPVQWRPGYGCERFHSQPDGNTGVNADGDLTRPPDYPTALQTCARLVPERLLLHATLTIRPASPPRVAIIVGVWLPHAALIPSIGIQARPVRLPLPIILCVIATAHRFGGFGLDLGCGTAVVDCARLVSTVVVSEVLNRGPFSTDCNACCNSLWTDKGVHMFLMNNVDLDPALHVLGLANPPLTASAANKTCNNPCQRAFARHPSTEQVLAGMVILRSGRYDGWSTPIREVRVPGHDKVAAAAPERHHGHLSTEGGGGRMPYRRVPRHCPG